MFSRSFKEKKLMFGYKVKMAPWGQGQVHRLSRIRPSSRPRYFETKAKAKTTKVCPRIVLS